MILFKKRITKALIRLRGCAGWSAPVLFANHRRQVFSRRGPNYNKNNYQMGLVKRKYGFVVCEQNRHIPNCTSAQSDHRLCWSLAGKYKSSTCHLRNFNIPASLCCWEGLIEHWLVGNPATDFLSLLFWLFHLHLYISVDGWALDWGQRYLGLGRDKT